MSTIRRKTDGRWLQIAVVVLTAIIAVNFAILIPTVISQHGESRAGQMARTTQLLKFPVSEKVYVHAYHTGVITKADLACFRKTSACPTPTSTP